MIDISGRRYVVNPPMGMRSFALQQRILPIAGRMVGALFTFVGDGDVTKLLDQDLTKALPAALPILGDVFASMPAGELEWLTRELLSDTTVEAREFKGKLFGGAAGDLFDAVMQGRHVEVWQLLWHALQVWYPDFFGLVQRSGAVLRAANGSSASTTSPTSGPVTASVSAAG